MSEMSILSAGVSLPPQGNPAVNAAGRDTKVAGETATRAVEPSRLSVQARQVEQVQQPDREKLETATQSVREFVKPINSNLEFSVNDDTGQLVVKIIDRTTREVIRQMPSEEMLSIAKTLDSIKGLFVTQTA